MSSETCPTCKKGRLTEETLGAETTKTCTSCGYSIEHTVLQVPSFSYQEGFTLSTEKGFEKKYKVAVDSKYENPNRKIILDKMRALLEKYPNSEVLYETAAEMYINVTEQAQDKYRREQAKNAMAASCLVIVLRNAGIPVLLTMVCRELQIDARKVLGILSRLKLQNKEGGYFETEDLMDVIFQSFPSLTEKKSLMDCAKKLWKLFYHLNLHTSRELMASAAMYYAIISEEPIQRSPMHVNLFCHQYHVNRTSAFDEIIASARKKLFLMAKRLPWVASTVTKRNMQFYIRDLLKSQHALIATNFNKISEPLVKQERECEEDDRSIDSLPTKKIKITEQMQLKLPKASIKNLLVVKPVQMEEPDPDCVSTSEIICEDDMPEEELNSYIRSSKEVEIVSKIKSSFLSAEDDE